MENNPADFHRLRELASRRFSTDEIPRFEDFETINDLANWQHANRLMQRDLGDPAARRYKPGHRRGRGRRPIQTVISAAESGDSVTSRSPLDNLEDLRNRVFLRGLT